MLDKHLQTDLSGTVLERSQKIAVLSMLNKTRIPHCDRMTNDSVLRKRPVKAIKHQKGRKL